MAAPLIVVPSSNQHGSLGQHLTLKVEIKGDPVSNIKWQVGRKKVKESSKYHLIFDPEKGEYGLEVKKVTEELTEGVWVVASNKHGEDCCCIKVDVDGEDTEPKDLKKTRSLKHSKSEIQEKVKSDSKKTNSLQINKKSSLMIENDDDIDDIYEQNKNESLSKYDQPKNKYKSKAKSSFKTKSSSLNRNINGNAVNKNDSNDDGFLLSNSVDRKKPKKQVSRSDSKTSETDFKQYKTEPFKRNNSFQKKVQNSVHEENKDNQENGTKSNRSMESEVNEDNTIDSGEESLWCLYDKNIVELCKQYLAASYFEREGETPIVDVDINKNYTDSFDTLSENNEELETKNVSDVKYDKLIHDDSAEDDDSFSEEDSDDDIKIIDLKPINDVEKEKMDSNYIIKVPKNKPTFEDYQPINKENTNGKKVQPFKIKITNDSFNSSEDASFSDEKSLDSNLYPFQPSKLPIPKTTINIIPPTPTTPVTQPSLVPKLPPQNQKTTELPSNTDKYIPKTKPSIDTKTTAPLINQKPPLVSKPPFSLDYRNSNKTLTTYVTSKKNPNSLRKQKQADRIRCRSVDLLKDTSDDDDADFENSSRQRLQSENYYNRPNSSASYTRSRIIPAKSEEILIIKKGSSKRLNRILNESADMGSLSSLYNKSYQSLDRSMDSSGLGKRTLSREWKVVTVTTTEETFLVDDGKNKKTKTCETSTEDLLSAVNESESPPKKSSAHKSVGSNVKEQHMASQTDLTLDIQPKKPKTYSFGQQTDLKQNDKPPKKNISKNETTQTTQPTQTVVPPVKTPQMKVVPAVIKPNPIPIENLKRVNEPELEYQSYEYGEMIRFYSENSEEAKELMGLRKNKRGYGGYNGDARYKTNDKRTDLYSKGQKAVEKMAQGPGENRDPRRLPKNQLFTFTQNQTFEEIVETSRIAAPYKNNVSNIPQNVCTDSHESQMSYLMNNFALNSEKDVNVKVEQNVNNITINIDGDDDPEKIFKLIKKNFPDGNRIKINYNKDGQLVEVNSGDNDATDGMKNESSIEDAKNKRKSINISRLGPGRYSLEYTEDDVNNANNFANLLELSKDRAKENEKMKQNLPDSFKTRLDNLPNKYKTTYKSGIDTIVTGPPEIKTIGKTPQEPETSIDRHVDIFRKSSSKVIKKPTEEVKKHGTSVDKKPSKAIAMLEKEPSLREKLDIV